MYICMYIHQACLQARKTSHMTCIYVCIYIQILYLGFGVIEQHVYVSTMFGTHPRGAQPFAKRIFLCCAECNCVDVYIYINSFPIWHTHAYLCVNNCFSTWYAHQVDLSIWCMQLCVCLFTYAHIHVGRLAFVCVYTCMCVPLRTKARQRGPQTHVFLSLVV